MQRKAYTLVLKQVAFYYRRRAACRREIPEQPPRLGFGYIYPNRSANSETEPRFATYTRYA